jgi:predicted GNAT family acetyltransferase
MTPDSEPEIRHNHVDHQYEIWVGGVRAGLTAYRLTGHSVAFMHTEIDDSFGGRGLGSTLIKHALDDVRDSGRTVVPYCPFVRAYIQKHPEYADLVPASRHQEFSLR